MTSDQTLVEMAAYFEAAAERFVQSGSPLYAAITKACVGDRDLLTLAAHAPAGQLPFYLLLGAVQAMLFEQPDAPLARFYPSLTPEPEPVEGAFAAFRAFCLDHAREIAATMRSRKVQLTTVSRAALLAPSMAVVAEAAGEPLSLIEVGCSVGLLTLFDHYRYDFGAAGQIGDPHGVLVSGAGFRDLPPAPKSLPRIGARVGVDLNPIDPNDPSERRWIEALIPPDWIDERRQLSAALDHRARTPLQVVTGDAMIETPKLLRTMAGPVCVLHAHCLYQWPSDARAAFDEMLGEMSDGRTIHRLSMEYADPRMTPLVEARAFDPLLPFEIIHSIFDNRRQTARRLAVYDGYGKEAVWLA